MVGTATLEAQCRCALLPVTALVGTGSPHDSECGSGVLTNGRGITKGVVALFPCPRHRTVRKNVTISSMP